MRQIKKILVRISQIFGAVFPLFFTRNFEKNVPLHSVQIKVLKRMLLHESLHSVLY